MGTLLGCCPGSFPVTGTSIEEAPKSNPKAR
jgi:hypothetical protein